MAAGIRATEAEIIAFVDSDSVLERDALRVIVQGFAERRVGRDRRSRRSDERARVLDHPHAGGALLRRVSRLQGGRVDLRRGHVLLRLLLRLPARGDHARARATGSSRRFLGRPATYGDDRSLTNYVLRDWKVRYETRALSHTIVPAHFRAVPAPAAALEAELDARVADRRRASSGGSTRSRACGRTSGSCCR